MESLEERRLLAAGVGINEFMAGNTKGYQDPAFAGPTQPFPDWIELYNPTNAAVPLQGWQLKDSASTWTFPAGASIASNGYLIVVADSKNLVDPTKIMHTNFDLSKGGEYLALVRSDTTIATEFVPEFPSQSNDISYGFVPTSITSLLLDRTGTFKAFVPQDDSLGTTWRNENFDDTQWLTGNGGAGFDTDVVPPQAPPGWTVRMVDTSTGTISNVKQGIDILNGNTAGYTVFSDTTATYPNIDFLEAGHFTNNRNLPNGFGVANGATVPERTNYALRATAKVTIPAGTYTIGVNSDDGFQLTIPGVTFTNRINENYVSGTILSASNQLTYGGLRNSSDTLGAFTVPVGGLTTTIQLDMFNNINSNMLECFIAAGTKSAFDGTFAPLGNNTFGWTVLTAGPDPSYQGQFGLNLQQPMLNNNATAYLRVPFTIDGDDLPTFTSLLLHMRYDDGFIAWINGQQVASANAPAAPTWNSTASGSHSDALAVIDQDFTLTNVQSYLHAGLNYLTIQAMNITPSDSDFLILPSLDAVTGTQDAARYFAVPTPGAANSTAYGGQVADTKFDHDRGFFDAPFQLGITTSTSGAVIRYTTNGTEPTVINGTVLAPGTTIPITKTTTLRARAFKDGFLPTNIDTQTFIFLSDVITQSASNSNNGTPPPGWPTSFSPNTTDYGMDPDVVNSATYSATIKNDLKTIPTLSIVTDVNNLFGTNGIYSNPNQQGIAWERPASLELINPDGSKGFQTDFGIRIRGGFSRTTDNPKHGLRVLLRSEYSGASLDFPLFKSQNGVDQPRSFDLRTFQNYSWSFQNDSRFIGLRDQFSRDTQIDMGWNAERGDMYNLYIDGQYWGIYNTDERPEADYAASYYGGDTNDYDVVKVEAGPYTINATDGNLTGWNAFWTMANQLRVAADQGNTSLVNSLYQQMQGNNADGTRNTALPVYLDAKNLIDYMLVIYYGGNLDAPISNFLGNTSPNNYYGIWNHTTKNMGFQFFSHDAEHTLLDATVSRLGPYTAGVSDFTKSNPQEILQQLMYNSDFRTLVADRIHKYLFNGGQLTVAANIARFNKRRDEINRAVVGESARWGDAKTGGAPYTYVTWETAINTVQNTFFPSRTNNLLTQFRNTAMGDGIAGNTFTMYPLTVDAPEFTESFGGTIPANGLVHLTNPRGASAGTIYYTLDGSDPRLSGGVLNPNALIYDAVANAGIPLSATTRVQARVRNGTIWSALTDATFVSATPPPLRVSEIMFHPANPPVGSPYQPDDFEYIEVQNISAAPLNLNKFAFSDGVAFTFGDFTLPAGGRAVVVSNPLAFQSRYGNAIPIAGTYSGHLDNSGEHLKLSGPLGETIQSFSYSDAWYPQTDGEGFSLESRNVNQPLALFDDKLGWRASNNAGGDPGADVPVTLSPGAVVINEIAAKVAVPNTTWLELANNTNAPIDLSNWLLSNDPLILNKYQLPAGTIIPANGYLVLNEQSSYGQAGLPLPQSAFTFDGDGNNTIVLSQADANGVLLGYREYQDYGAADVGQTLGRLVKASTGGTDFVIQKNPSQGADNAGPLSNTAVINEVMYGPVAAFNGTNFPNPNKEFVEIRNVTKDPLNLFDPANPANAWRLTGGIEFTFPANISIPAYSYVVISNITPAAFRALYPSVPAAVQVFGPASGFLDNAGEKIRLQRPGIANALGVIPYITVDTLSYNNKAPWPTTPNETGPSLIRKLPMAYGNDPANWQASLANGGTPGVDNLPSLPPTVAAPPSFNGIEGGTYTQDISFTDPDLGQTYTASINWGDTTNTTYNNVSSPFTISHLYRDSGAFKVTVTVFDSGLASGSNSANLNIANIAPTGTFGGATGILNVPEGSSRSIGFANVTDPSINDTNSGFKFSFDWNNDGVYDVVDSGSPSQSIPDAMLADGPRTQIIKGKVADKDGGFTEYTATLNVTNVTPIVDPIADQSFAAPTQFDYAGGTFFDTGTLDAWTGQVDWNYHVGDTATAPFAVNPDGTFSLHHNFGTPGTFVVRVGVADKDGAVGYTTFNVTVGGPDTIAPTLTSGPQFLYQSGPRKIAVTFSEEVGASISQSNLIIRNLNTDTDLPANAATFAWDDNTYTATWTFSSSSLPDANYHATFHTAGIKDVSNNPLAGGGDLPLDFFFLYGDANRDKQVDFNDLVLLAQHYNITGGMTWADGDFTGDGNVDFNDLVIMAQHYNTALASPPVGGAVASDPATAAVLSIGPSQMPALSTVLAMVKSGKIPATPTPTPTPKPTPKPAPKPIVVIKPKTPAAAATAAAPVFSNTRIATAKKRNDLLN